MSRGLKILSLLLVLSAAAFFLNACTIQSCNSSCSGEASCATVSDFDGMTKSADGLPIHYTSNGHGHGKPALVFVHGWSCDLEYWDSQVAAFSGEHQVVCIDLGGHGKSGLEREDWSMRAFGTDVNTAIDALELDDVILVGHSMGGAVITEAALANPKRVRGLVGVDNMQELDFKLTDAQIDGYLAQFAADFPTVVDGWVRQMFPAGVDSALVDRIASDMASGPPAVGLSAMGNMLRWLGNSKAAFIALPAPYLGINSDIQPTDRTGLVAARPDYELRIMAGGSHFLAQERPDEFNALLAECVASLIAKR